MKNCIWIMIALFCINFFQPSHAQTNQRKKSEIKNSDYYLTQIDQIEKTLGVCIANATNPSESIKCSGVAFDESDKILNTVYQKLLTQLPIKDKESEEIRKRLVRAQKTWITSRDYDCALMGGATLGIGGSAERQITSNCKANYEIDRARFLIGFLE